MVGGVDTGSVSPDNLLGMAAEIGGFSVDDNTFLVLGENKLSPPLLASLQSIGPVELTVIFGKPSRRDVVFKVSLSQSHERTQYGIPDAPFHLQVETHPCLAELLDSQAAQPCGMFRLQHAGALVDSMRAALIARDWRGTDTNAAAALAALDRLLDGPPSEVAEAGESLVTSIYTATAIQ